MVIFYYLKFVPFNMLKLSTNTMLLGRQCLCESPVIVKYCCRAESILSDSGRVTLLGPVLVVYLRETHIVSRRWAAERDLIRGRTNPEGFLDSSSPHETTMLNGP